MNWRNPDDWLLFLPCLLVGQLSTRLDFPVNLSLGWNLAGKWHLGCFAKNRRVFRRRIFHGIQAKKTDGLAGAKQPKVLFVTCLFVGRFACHFGRFIYHGHLILSPWCILRPICGWGSWVSAWVFWIHESAGAVPSQIMGVGGRGEWRHDTPVGI